MKSEKILYISVHPLLSQAIRLFLLNDPNPKRNLDINIVNIDEVMRLDIKVLIANPPDLILFPVGFPGAPDLHLVVKHRAAGVKAPVIILCRLLRCNGTEIYASRTFVLIQVPTACFKGVESS